MILNWWTFYKLDKDKFWLGGKFYKGYHIMGNRPIPDNWWFWKGTKTAERCEETYTEITEAFHSNEYLNITKLIKTHLYNGEGVKRCFWTWSDLFYVPNKFSNQFQWLSSIFYKNRVFLECAVPTMMSFIDVKDSWEMHYGFWMPDTYGNIDFADGNLISKHYNYEINFMHPVKYHGDVAKTNRERLKNDIIPYSKRFTKC